MKTIKENANNEIIIRNSRFITYLYYITSLEEVSIYLEKVKITWKDASHYCYCYILPNSSKASDDNEPSKTAGIPMLEVLKKNDLTNILAITVRYFGGIKLGAGGLIRAYASSIRECLKKCEIVNLSKGYLYKIETSYTNTKQISYLLRNETILNKEYLDQVVITFQSINPNILDNLNDIKLISKEEVLIKNSL